MTLMLSYKIASIAGSGKMTGLDYDGTGSARRMLYWSSPPAMYPMTYLFKVYQRNQVSDVGDGTRYYTTFFWGNNGEFSWGTGYGRSYYGAHPYPYPDNDDNGKWEISANAVDYLDDAPDGIAGDYSGVSYVTNNDWYSQAFVAENTEGNVHTHKFYIDLPSTADANVIEVTLDSASVEPPSPAIMFGQAPDNGSGASWGGYSRWEEQNAIIRGIQIYNSALTEEQIIALAALETDAAILSKCTELSITSLWYLNMNPTPTDVTDKKGSAAKNGLWAGAARPDLWESA
jgi:hypothetical protein